jgi:hypothetical protein
MAKTRYYIIWIEGLSARYGEKVRSLSNTSFNYTTRMTDSMRIRECDIHYMKDYMRRHGIAQWVIDSNQTFIKTNYVPKGTLYKFPQI